MKLKNRLFIVLVLIGATVFGQGENLKKITVVESNNPILNYNYEKLPLKDSINTLEFKELKGYVLSRTTIKSKNEPELFFELMKWVSNQWKHDGWHAAPDSLNSLGILKSAHDDGQQYRCVEYGGVLNDILNSFGYVARTVGLKHKDADYGGAGMGHVATEVWSNKLNKWIFLDPQFGIYAQKDNVPLNIFEIYQIKKVGNFEKIEFIEVKTNKASKDYGTGFLTNYLGYIDINQNYRNKSYSLALKMEGERDFLTFQAFPRPKVLYTSNFEDVYFSINQTMVLFDYNEDEITRTEEEFGKLDIKTVEDFNDNMAIFAAKPNFILSFDNNMPWFKNYIVKLNNSVIEEQNKKYCVNLKKGMNTLTILAVNQNGIEGVPTVIKLKYE
ncbi:transglutaminase domain-containing protein [Labilibaculum euxinus]